MAAITICSDLGAPKNKVWYCFLCFPIYLLWNVRTGCHNLSFLYVKPAFSLPSFTFIKRLLSSSSLSAIRVISSAYLRLLIFLLTTLISAYDSISPAVLWMQTHNMRDAKSRGCSDSCKIQSDEISEDSRLTCPLAWLPWKLGRVLAFTVTLWHLACTDLSKLSKGSSHLFISYLHRHLSMVSVLELSSARSTQM